MSETRLDLYHHSLVIAGYQMTKNLARATTLGTCCANVGQFVGVGVHLYNLLRQLKLVDEESVLLENLCNVVGHCISRGPRPTRKFFTNLAAFQGIAIKWHKRTRKYSVVLSQERENRLFPYSISILSGLNENDFNPYCGHWDSV